MLRDEQKVGPTEAYRRAVYRVERLEFLPRAQVKAEYEEAIRQANVARVNMTASRILSRLRRAAEQDPDRELDGYLDELENLGRWSTAARACEREIERLSAMSSGQRRYRYGRLAEVVNRHNAALDRIAEKVSA